MKPRKIYSCSCGGWKFYCTWGRAICWACGKVQPHRILGDSILIPTTSPPQIEEVVVLSETD